MAHEPDTTNEPDRIDLRSAESCAVRWNWLPSKVESSVRVPLEAVPDIMAVVMPMFGAQLLPLTVPEPSEVAMVKAADTELPEAVSAP